MDAVILGGGRCPAELAKEFDCASKSGLPLAGSTLGAIVADAIGEAAGGRMFTVGYGVDGSEQVEPGESFLDSLRHGMERVTSTSFVVAAADMPFLKADSVLKFLEKAEEQYAINYPIVDVGLVDQTFPQMARTSLRIREGTFTGGNIAVCSKALMTRILPILEDAYANRKSPIRLATQVGFGTLLRVAIARVMPSTLPLITLERAVAAFLGEPVKAHVVPCADLAADIDSVEHYRVAAKILEKAET